VRAPHLFEPKGAHVIRVRHIKSGCQAFGSGFERPAERDEDVEMPVFERSSQSDPLRESITERASERSG
jgi:hypothetical protein